MTKIPHERLTPTTPLHATWPGPRPRPRWYNRLGWAMLLSPLLAAAVVAAVAVARLLWTAGPAYALGTLAVAVVVLVGGWLADRK